MAKSSFDFLFYLFYFSFLIYYDYDLDILSGEKAEIMAMIVAAGKKALIIIPRRTIGFQVFFGYSHMVATNSNSNVLVPTINW